MNRINKYNFYRIITNELLINGCTPTYDKKIKKEEEYKKLKLYKMLRDDLASIVDNKNAYFKELKERSIYDLTRHEASLLNKESQWNDLFVKCIRYAHATLPYSDRGITYIDKYANLSGIESNNITPNFIIEMTNRFKDKTYDEVKKIIDNMKKEQKKKK